MFTTKTSSKLLCLTLAAAIALPQSVSAQFMEGSTYYIDQYVIGGESLGISESATYQAEIGVTNFEYDVVDTDGDGFPDVIETMFGSNPADPNSIPATDTDGDGSLDATEQMAGTDENNVAEFPSDSDSDGVPDVIEVIQGTDPNDPTDYQDTDGDNVPDFVEADNGSDVLDPASLPTTDSDSDGYPDWVEDIAGSNPSDPASIPDDTDTDGLPDVLEDMAGTDDDDLRELPLSDVDGDGFPDWVETFAGTDPTDPASFPNDTDSDGVPDVIEVVQGTDPNDPDEWQDTDGDDVADYVEVVGDGTDPLSGPGSVSSGGTRGGGSSSDDQDDDDNDGIPNGGEEAGASDADDDTSIPADADGDGFPDDIEIDSGSNPNAATDATVTDSDGDGFPDDVEILAATDPNDVTEYPQDSDGDGVPDVVEIIQGTDLSDITDYQDSDNGGIPDYVELLDGTNPFVVSDDTPEPAEPYVPPYNPGYVTPPTSVPVTPTAPVTPTTPTDSTAPSDTVLPPEDVVFDIGTVTPTCGDSVPGTATETVFIPLSNEQTAVAQIPAGTFVTPAGYDCSEPYQVFLTVTPQTVGEVQSPHSGYDAAVVDGAAYTVSAVDSLGNQITSWNQPIDLSISSNFRLSSIPSAAGYFFSSAQRAWVAGDEVQFDGNGVSFSVAQASLFGVWSGVSDDNSLRIDRGPINMAPQSEVEQDMGTGCWTWFGIHTVCWYWWLLLIPAIYIIIRNIFRAREVEEVIAEVQ